MLIFVKERVLEWKRYSPLQFAIQRYREEFLGLGKMHQGKVLVSMAEYFPLFTLLPPRDECIPLPNCNKRVAEWNTGVGVYQQ